MLRKIKLRNIDTKIKYTEKGYITLKPNVINVLIGPNGTGKTKALNQIKDYCITNNINHIYWSTLKNSGSDGFSKYLFNGNVELAASHLFNSEGENILICIMNSIKCEIKKYLIKLIFLITIVVYLL